ncbi:MAG: hypothetical protein ABI232_05695, partial [Jatrophihabitantaceae bacterium]
TGTSTGTSTDTGTTSAAPEPSSIDINKYLLNVGDVGGGFVTGTYTPATTGQPCTPDEPPLNEKIPSRAAGGRTFDNAKVGAEFGEQVLIYRDEATAKQALAAGEHGMDCKTGKVFYDDGTTGSVTITSVSADLSSELDTPVDDSAAWSLENSDLKGSLIVVRSGVKLVVLTFSANADADTTSLPDSLKLTNAAVSRAINGQ